MLKPVLACPAEAGRLALSEHGRRQEAKREVAGEVGHLEDVERIMDGIMFGFPIFGEVSVFGRAVRLNGNDFSLKLAVEVFGKIQVVTGLVALTVERPNELFLIEMSGDVEQAAGLAAVFERFELTSARARIEDSA